MKDDRSVPCRISEKKRGAPPDPKPAPELGRFARLDDGDLHLGVMCEPLCQDDVLVVTVGSAFLMKVKNGDGFQRGSVRHASGLQLILA